MPCSEDRLPIIAYAPVPSLDWTTDLTETVDRGLATSTSITVRLANAGSATMPACLEYDAMAMYPEGPA